MCAGHTALTRTDPGHHRDCPVWGGNAVPFPIHPGIVIYGNCCQELLLLSAQAREEVAWEDVLSHLVLLRVGDSPYGIRLSGQAWLCRIRDFTLEESNLRKVKLLKRFLSPVTKAPNGISPYRKGDHVSQNMHVHPNTHDNSVDTLGTFPQKIAWYHVFPFGMNK